MNDALRELHRKRLTDAGIEPDDEDSLLAAIPNTDDFYLLKDIVVGLQQQGTQKSIPTLKELLKYPKQDIKIISFTAIANILGKEGQDLYIEYLEDPKYREKAGPVRAIRDYCDGRASAAILSRVKQMLRRERRAVAYSSGQETELTVALEYLSRCGSKETEEAFELVRGNVTRLEQRERARLTQQIPELLGAGEVEPENEPGQQDAGGKDGKRSWFASLWRR